MAPGPQQAPAGWHPDPWQRSEHRYWDGARWTEHVVRGGQQTVDHAAPTGNGPAATPAANPSGGGPLPTPGPAGPVAAATAVQAGRSSTPEIPLFGARGRA